MRLDHINIVTPDVEATTAFFADILGLHVGHRPPFAFPGAWLYGDDEGGALVHLVEGDIGAGPTGALDHVAFRGKDRPRLIDRLNQRGIDCTTRTVPGSGDEQVFFTAPFGLKIEVSFSPS